MLKEDLEHMQSTVLPSGVYQWQGHINLLNNELITKDLEATLTANVEVLEFKGLHVELKFARSQIVQIRRAGLYPWCWAGICLEHQISEYPRYVYFGAHWISSKAVLSHLKALGWPV